MKEIPKFEFIQKESGWHAKWGEIVASGVTRTECIIRILYMREIIPEPALFLPQKTQCRISVRRLVALHDHHPGIIEAIKILMYNL